jgi:hypothetical protein
MRALMIPVSIIWFQIKSIAIAKDKGADNTTGGG